MTAPDGVRISVDWDRIAELCRRYHILKLWFFGSVLREDFRPDSDVDVLVLFEEGKTPGLEFVTIVQELEEILGRPVDLLTEPSLRNPYRRREILRSRRLVYAA
jgi:predicted nucleotidyltransferase